MPTTILVDVRLQKTDADEHDASLQELRQLIETLGWEIAGTITQKMSSLIAAALIGPGKLEELSTGKERVLAEIRKNVHVLRESYDERGACLTIKAAPGTLSALKRRLASETLSQKCGKPKSESLSS